MGSGDDRCRAYRKIASGSARAVIRSATRAEAAFANTLLNLVSAARVL